MKTRWVALAVVAVAGVVGKTYADTQNILLSGDIRVRGYYLARAGNDGGAPALQSPGDASFISQRTRVTVAAEMDSHLLAVVTLKAEGLWGSDDSTGLNTVTQGGSGAGLPNVIDRGFALGVNEAYLQINELFSSPATLKIGRQFLNYGHGLILSSFEQEYNFDAARLVIDQYPVTYDLVAASLVNNQAFNASPNSGGAADLLFLNARYETTDTVIKNIEAYLGWVALSHKLFFGSPRVPPTDPLLAGDASPWIIGLRGDLAPVSGFDVWFEAAYEGGADGNLAPDSKSISAYLLNAGARWTMKDVRWTPALNFNYLLASGGGKSESSNFRPWFNYTDGYFGYLYSPVLSNIQIFNLGGMVKPSENASFSLQGYYYMNVDKDSGYGGYSDLNIDFGGLGFANASGRSDGSWEVDSIFGYDYSKDLRLQIVYGAFIPGLGFRASGVSAVAHEVRGEINVKF